MYVYLRERYTLIFSRCLFHSEQHNKHIDYYSLKNNFKVKTRSIKMKRNYIFVLQIIVVFQFYKRCLALK